MRLAKLLSVFLAVLMVSASMVAADHNRVRSNNSDVEVSAPSAEVDVRRDGTRTRVEAPNTNVDVNTQRRRVRIRVPYFSRDIRW